MNHQLLHHDRPLIIPVERAVITVWVDEDEGDTLYCNEFGVVHDWNPKLQSSHQPRTHNTCVHRLVPLEATQLICPRWASKLHWQPTLITTGPPMIASRTNDVVTLGFNAIGPTTQCGRTGSAAVERQCSYRLHRMRWFDQDEPASDVLLGVRM